MSQTNDCKYNALSVAGFQGAVNDKELAWLQSLGATSGQINDAWLEVAGAGEYNDQVMAYMIAQGAIGSSFSDVLNDFWCRVMGGNPRLPPQNVLTTDAGDPLTTSSGDFLVTESETDMATKLSEYRPYHRSNTILTPIITDNPSFQPVVALNVSSGLPNGEYVLSSSWIFQLPDTNDAMLWRFVIDGVAGETFKIEAKDVTDQDGWAFMVDWQVGANAVDLVLEARVENGGNDAIVSQAYIGIQKTEDV